jgi:hypothetical protein
VVAEQDSVEPAAKAEQWVFQEETPVGWKIGKRGAQTFDLLVPGTQLLGVVELVGFDEAEGEAFEDVRWVLRTE